METMTANYSQPPYAAVTQSPSPRAQQATTRTVQQQQQADAHHHHHQQHHHHHHHRHHHPTLSAPASQESIVSVQSSFGSSSTSKLLGSDSSLSQLTTYTDPTSPNSRGASHQATGNRSPDASQPATINHTQQHSQRNAPRPRNRTPENGQNGRHSPTRTAESAWYSPMSITSPVAGNGAKRTASGHVKNAHSMTNSSSHAQFPGRDSRRESLSSSGSKAGEIAATLKARLSYAMAKVQNGWEHKSLAEVEQLAAERQRKRSSMSQVEQQRPGTSGLSNGASRLSMYDHYARPAPDMNAPPPSKRMSGNYSHYRAQSQHHYPPQSTAPRLQPAPDIRPSSSQRAACAGPTLQPFPQHVSSAMSPPRTPVNAVQPQRPATIRTETQTAEAEREALQALFQLGSPHTSVGPHIARSGTATTNSSRGQMSPIKAELTPRHVTFVRSESASTSSSSVDTGALQESRTRLVEQLADQ